MAGYVIVVHTQMHSNSRLHVYTCTILYNTNDINEKRYKIQAEFPVTGFKASSCNRARVNVILIKLFPCYWIQG